ncbi:MAG: GLPGLI family protein [Psychroserpens sp.]|jgi:GLPGLI family protein|uniref:GLPGLI family protein n=1 Tax=Psychroserpens sp. TaxID=2020870 RepID=UPI0039E6C595
MLKKIIYFFPLIFIFNVYSQVDKINTYSIEFEKTLVSSLTLKEYTSIYSLDKFINLNVSVFDKLSKSKNPNQIINDEDDDQIYSFTPGGDNVNLVYKNYSTGKTYLNHQIISKPFLVEDSLQVFSWLILNETKKILGYSCQSASMSFRGREYKAWFTPELPIGGPWKFDGLPGMILLIKSDDSFISYEAIKINNNFFKTAKINNPFNINKAITWQEFKKLYKKKAIALATYSPNEEDSGGIILSRRGIETYIEEDDTDYTADKDFEKSQDN